MKKNHCLKGRVLVIRVRHVKTTKEELQAHSLKSRTVMQIKLLRKPNGLFYGCAFVKVQKKDNYTEVLIKRKAKEDKMKIL